MFVWYLLQQQGSLISLINRSLAYLAGLPARCYGATSRTPTWFPASQHRVDLGGKRFLHNTHNIRENASGPCSTQKLCTKMKCSQSNSNFLITYFDSWDVWSSFLLGLAPKASGFCSPLSSVRAQNWDSHFWLPGINDFILQMWLVTFGLLKVDQCTQRCLEVLFSSKIWDWVANTIVTISDKELSKRQSQTKSLMHSSSHWCWMYAPQVGPRHPHRSIKWPTQKCSQSREVLVGSMKRGPRKGLSPKKRGLISSPELGTGNQGLLVPSLPELGFSSCRLGGRRDSSDPPSAFVLGPLKDSIW